EQAVNDHANLLLHALPQLLGSDRADLNQDLTLPSSGAEHPHRFVVLSLGDLSLREQHVAEPFLRDAAGRKNDIAVFYVQALLDAIFFEAQDTRFPGNSQEFKNIRQAQG